MKKTLSVILLSSVISLAACSSADEATESAVEKKEIHVETTEVIKGNLEADKTIYGQAKPTKQIPVMLQAPGTVDELKVKNGAQVNKDNSLAVIKTEMGKQTIKAPEKGEVAKLPASSGSFVSNEEPFAYIVDSEKMNIELAVTAKFRKLFKEDKKVSVEVDGAKYDGTVLSLDSMPNDNGQYLVYVQFENKDKKVMPYEMAQVTVKEGLLKDVLIVPTAAVITSEEADYVYVIEDNKAKKVTIEIEESLTDKTAIKGEIKEKAQVVTKGHLTLSDEAPVTVKKDGK